MALVSAARLLTVIPFRFIRCQIATAKVSLVERQGIPHHLIDFVSSVRLLPPLIARAAIDKIEEIEMRQRVFRLAVPAPPVPCAGRSFLVRILMKTARPFDEDSRCRGPEHSSHSAAIRSAEAEKRTRGIGPGAAGDRILLTDWPADFQERPLRPDPPALAERIRVIAPILRAELYSRINIDRAAFR